MTATLAIFRRELASYFRTPLAAIFIVIFLILSGGFTFYQGEFLARGQADLQPFFALHPWLWLVLIPALTMRLWAEERRTGTIELLLTLPVTMGQAVLGKFLAAWAFAALALALTFPFWLTVNWLGLPDNGVILAAYFGSLLMAGAFLAIGGCISAATRSQVIAFVVTATVCLIFVLSGSGFVLGALRDVAPGWLAAAIARLSFLAHFQSISRGVLDLRDLFFFVSAIGVFLAANAIIVDLTRGA